MVALRTEVLSILYSLPEAALICSLNVQLELVESQIIVLSVAPLSVIPPPLAVVSVGVATVPNSILISSTVTVSYTHLTLPTSDLV